MTHRVDDALMDGRERVRDFIYDCTNDGFGHGWTLSAEEADRVIKLALEAAGVAELREALEGLNAHVEAMQRAVTSFLLPDSETSDADLVSTLIEMLDGPAQREIQGKARAVLANQGKAQADG